MLNPPLFDRKNPPKKRKKKKPVVRPLETNDLPALYRLIPRLWIEQGHPPTNETWIDTSKSFIKKNLGTQVFGAIAIDPDKSDEIISCGLGVILQQIPTFWNISGRCGFCQWFYTTPEYRGQKLGDQIMHIIIHWFTDQGISRVQLNATRKAMPFYKRFGFEAAEGWPQMEWKKYASSSI